MFESFKSAETLESELRNWLVQHYKCAMQNNYSNAQLEEVVWLYKEKWLIGVLEDATNACMSLSENIELSRIVGQTTYTELALRKKGLKLIMALFNWYLKAAVQGDATAQWLVGEILYKGAGVNVDYAAAVKWFRKAAEQGHTDAQYRLGNCYAEGKGVEKDYAEAVMWFRKAAEHNDSTAQDSLGDCYATGKGVTKNLVEAYKWYNLAADQGLPHVQKSRDIVAQQMTPEQIAEAQRLSREFQSHTESHRAIPSKN